MDVSTTSFEIAVTGDASRVKLWLMWSFGGANAFAERVKPKLELLYGKFIHFDAADEIPRLIQFDRELSNAHHILIDLTDSPDMFPIHCTALGSGLGLASNNTLVCGGHIADLSFEAARLRTAFGCDAALRGGAPILAAIREARAKSPIDRMDVVLSGIRPSSEDVRTVRAVSAFERACLRLIAFYAWGSLLDELRLEIGPAADLAAAATTSQPKVLPVARLQQLRSQIGAVIEWTPVDRLGEFAPKYPGASAAALHLRNGETRIVQSSQSVNKAELQLILDDIERAVATFDGRNDRRSY